MNHGTDQHMLMSTAACLAMSCHVLWSWTRLFSFCSPVLHQLTMSSVHPLHGLRLFVRTLYDSKHQCFQFPVVLHPVYVTKNSKLPLYSSLQQIFFNSKFVTILAVRLTGYNRTNVCIRSALTWLWNSSVLPSRCSSSKYVALMATSDSKTGLRTHHEMRLRL